MGFGVIQERACLGENGSFGLGENEKSIVGAFFYERNIKFSWVKQQLPRILWQQGTTASWTGVPKTRTPYTW